MNEQNAQRQYLILHLAVGLIAIAVALYLFGLLASDIVNKRPIVEFDQNVATVLHAWATPPLTSFFIFVSMLGLQVLWAVFSAVLVYLAINRQWIHLITWVVGALGGEILNQVLKNIFDRPRPVFTNPLATAESWSFPSGHAMESAILYGLLAYFLLLGVRSRAGRIAIIVAAIVLLLLIGLSRLYLGVHFFSDVAGGYAAGAVWLTVCIGGMETARWHIPVRHRQPTST